MSSNTTHPSADPQQDGQLHHQPPPPPQKPIFFGPFEVTNQVFLTTPHSFALVNLKPLLPGHVLVCPLRPHQRLTDLSPAEVTDLFSAVQRVQRMLARHYFHPQPVPPASFPNSTSEDYLHPGPPTSSSTTPGGAFNIALQDGPEAGQTVPHVHVHVIPRIVGSTAKPASTPSDAIYEQMAGEAGNVGGALYDTFLRARPRPGGSFPPIEDAERVARGMAEMEEEAEVYKRVLEEMGEEVGR
ncbi:Bis-tetraphosphatase [Staphylotrichum tortipilum]|uniref:Bis(5'-adenosyl)-triphosphatase n=1 Tax=Staphylotrichum tortipilum TaxID=2831512 RepID=A0AAN6MTH8_9PEZI|nr:Bis-tetraphosphatase [Staphylotrichum longicolle]